MPVWRVMDMWPFRAHSHSFDYEKNRWASADSAQLRRWREELERADPENVRRRVYQTDAGSRGDLLIGEVSMPKGFAEDWLAWHSKQNARREITLRRWQILTAIATAVGAIGWALTIWRKW